jgi:hypothetical protein
MTGKEIDAVIIAVFVPKLSFWLVQNPSEERFPANGNDRLFIICKYRLDI